MVDESLGPRSHRFAIRGTVEVEAAREFEHRLREAVLNGKSTVVVDLSEVAGLSPSLIGVLIRTQRSISWRNGRLLIACESATIRNQLADLNDIFDLIDTAPPHR